MFPNYEYTETNSPEIEPGGDSWEYWSMRTGPNESVAVWRRVIAELSY